MTAAAAAVAEESSSFFSTLASFFVPTAHAEEPAEEEKEEPAEDKEEGGDEPAPEAEEEEEEEEPEDLAPAIREECEASPECQGPSKHFKHCAEKVEGGKGWHGEDCVEELFHLMHCVDACAAPKLFKKLA